MELSTMNELEKVISERDYYKAKYLETLNELNELKSVAGKIADRYLQEDRLGIDSKEIIDKYLNGVTAYRLAKEYGCNIGTVINRLKRAGVYKSKY